MKVNMRGGGGTLDRVVINNWPEVYVRMYMGEGNVYELAIMIDNDVTQTKYVANMPYTIALSSTSVGKSVHIVIDNVTKNMGQKLSDAQMNVATTITINDGFDSSSYGTWTSTIEPDNVTVELDCEVVDNSTDVIVSKCGPDLWPNSVFNRIPILVSSDASFGYGSDTNYVMFGKQSFPVEGSVHSSWNESILYDVGGHESSLTINNQLTIMGLPESFVSHWVNTIHAKAYMGTGYVMLVPPSSS